MKNLFVSLSFLFSYGFLWSASPVPYSGKVAISGVNYHGEAYFTFSLHDGNGTTVWQNGQTPDSTIQVRVHNGRYNVLLGGQGMNALPPQLFLDYEELYLKVHFDNGDGNGLRHLTPDQRSPPRPGPWSRRLLSAQPHRLPSQFNPEQLPNKCSQTANSDESGCSDSADAPTFIHHHRPVERANPQIFKARNYPQPAGTRIDLWRADCHPASQAEGKYLSYQWYKNGQPITGATGDRYVIEDINKTQHDGNYSVVVSNDFGSVTTQPTQLLVDGTPTSHTVASISMDMIFCPPGTFTMGSPTNETGRGADETQHQVTLTNGFYLGKYEVTQAQYETVIFRRFKCQAQPMAQ